MIETDKNRERSKEKHAVEGARLKSGAQIGADMHFWTYFAAPF